MYRPIAVTASPITSPLDMKFMATYRTIEAAPMAMVENVGVWYFGCILANCRGSALYTAMDSVVLAVGRIVVWVEAAAEDSTMSSSRWVRNEPKPDPPNTAWPWMDSTSLALSGLFRPFPVSPTPAKDIIDRTTRA